MMKRYAEAVLLSSLLVMSTAHVAVAKSGPFEQAAKEKLLNITQEFVDERHQPWRFTFRANGVMSWFQNEVKDPNIYWDYRTGVDMEIARGRGHRLWFGTIYRQTAGHKPSQTVTPLDPRHIDVAETFAWRWKVGEHLRVFSRWIRWCFHEIDVHNRSAVFFTYAGLGVGTVAPTETAEPLIKARWTEESQIDGFLQAGPVINGGPVDILGLTTTYQAMAKARLSGAVPVTGTLVTELAVEWEVLLLHENATARDRHRGDLRLSFAAVRENGAATLFVGRTLMDTWIDRTRPVSWYLGTEYRF
jgi:hypothetical protein